MSFKFTIINDNDKDTDKEFTALYLLVKCLVIVL